MASSGSSQAQIATELGVTQQTVSRWFRSAEAAGARVSRKPGGRPAAAPSEPELAGDNPELDARLAELDIPSELAIVRAEWLPEARRQVTRALAANNAAQARDWMRIYVDTAERLLRAIPAPPPEPVDDPANLEARDEVLGHLRRLAEVRGQIGRASCRERV